MAGDGGNLAVVRFDVRDGLVFAAGDHQRAGDGAIEVDLAHLAAGRHAQKSFIDRTISAMRDSPSATQRQRGRQFFAQVFDVVVAAAARHRGVQRVDVREQFLHAFADERYAVAEILDRRVDFVRHAGGEPADDSSRSLEAMRSSAALRSVMSKPMPTMPVRLPSASCSGTLEVRITRSVPGACRRPTSSRSISALPDWISACSLVKNFSAISRG